MRLSTLAHQARLRQIQSNDRRLVANVRMNDLSCPEHKQAPWACIPLASPRRTIHTYNTYYIQLLHPIAENFPSSLDIRYSVGCAYPLLYAAEALLWQPDIQARVSTILSHPCARGSQACALCLEASRRKALWVSREERRLPDVGKAAKEHHHTF